MRPRPKKERMALRRCTLTEPLLAGAAIVPPRGITLYAGLRKGELCGLLKSDVDVDAGVITVRRSYDRETTKGGHADVIPVAPALEPYLQAAIDESPSELVFPWPDGSMRSPECDPAKVLRRALARAGLVEGYDHSCLRCKSRGTPHVERYADAALRRCPACNAKLWPKALPRPMRFHDLRHTAHRCDADAARRRRCAPSAAHPEARLGDDHDRHLRPSRAGRSPRRRDPHRAEKIDSVC
jgi:integrase